MPHFQTINGVTYEVTGHSILGAVPPPVDPEDPPAGLPAPNGADIIPALTSNNSPAGYVADATSQYSEAGVTAAAFKAFNRSTASGWQNGWSSAAAPSPTAPQRLWCMLPAPAVCYTYSVKIRADVVSLSPTAWTVEGYNGTGWVQIGTESGVVWTAGETKQFNIASPGAYSGYRWSITSGGALVQIDELRARS